MNCDFCGAPHATRMEIPDLRYPVPNEDSPNFLSRWGHPLTGNACRECLVGQLLKASGGQLVVKPTKLSEHLMSLCDILIGISATHFWLGYYVTCGIGFGLAIASAAMSSITSYPTKRDGKK